eukprot:364808-Chlamydomonas_euryale.AAC.6
MVCSSYWQEGHKPHYPRAAREGGSLTNFKRRAPMQRQLLTPGLQQRHTRGMSSCLANCVHMCVRVLASHSSLASVRRVDQTGQTAHSLPQRLQGLQKIG